jgi:RHS repeat-associated protein
VAGRGHQLTVQADLAGGAYQKTQFVYGVTVAGGSNFTSNDVLGALQYPDPTTGNPSSSQQESYTVNALGERKTKTDRNGNVHTYTIDVLGRQVADAVRTLGSGVDGSVRRIETAYDGSGNPYLFTSYDAASAGNVVNQVQGAFNGLGQLTTEYQAHSGVVNTGTTPKVQYAYSEMSGGANHSRQTSMTYPNARVITFNYNSGLDSGISRLSSISDGATTLEVYSYLGEAMVVKRAHPQPGVDLTYIKQTGESNGDAGDQYTGLDRFGRIVDQRWIVTSTGTATERFKYGYDRDGNRLYRDNLVNAAFGELYHANGAANGYDNLNQLKGFARGALSDTNTDTVPDTISSPARSQGWSLDALGNWDSVTTDASTQTRSANKQNEITSISGQTTPGYDANGNTTTDQTGKSLIYDAWNRLVQFKSGQTVLVSYAYDALNRRVVENPGTAVDLFFSQQWQVIEERVGGTPKIQYVWSPVYVDAMIERDRDADGNTGNGLEERLYVQQDGTWNVTAVISTTGSVQERYVEDPYGLASVLAADWSSRGSSSFTWIYLHQGGRLDSTSALYTYRNRDYSASLGRWLQHDSAGFSAGDPNLYRYIDNRPTVLVDPSGQVPIEVKMDAFIGKHLGVWNQEPYQIPFPFLPTYWFKGDDRNAGENFTASRLRSWFTIDSDQVGKLPQVNVQTRTGISVRGYWFLGTWVERQLQSTWTTTATADNEALGTCTSKVSVTAAVNYPFVERSPDIDYTFIFYFYHRFRDVVATKIVYNHNQFPDYEVVINDNVVYYYETKGSGPGLWNLALGPNTKGVVDGPTFSARPCCSF